MLYDGQVMHARMKPKAHRFTYQVYSLVIDVMRLTEAHALSRFFSVGRFNLVSFHEKDHGPKDNRIPLADHVRRLLADAGLATPPARILLLCYPRVIGFTFNPIAVYFVYDASDHLIAIVYEVRNTFGEMHTYVAPVVADELSEAGLRQERDKLFYVSPFIEMAMHYKFRLRPPTHDLALRILETDAHGPMLSASFVGTHRDLTNRSIISTFLRIPFMTLKVVAGIHFEAMKLWFKGVRFYRRPPPPPASSANGTFQNPNSIIGGHQ